MERPSDEDWLNEAIAHVVELRASGSWNNLSHRVCDFVTHPESSPLIVRDYYHSEFWRHDGCRGAAFLFMRWCVDQAGDSLFDRLLDRHGCTVESLEIAMGRPLPELFRGWTHSLGQAVANEISGAERACTETGTELQPHGNSSNLSHNRKGTTDTIFMQRRAEQESRRPTVHCQKWNPTSDDGQVSTIRIRGACSAYIHVDCRDSNDGWGLRVSASQPAQVQATLIPILAHRASADSR